MGKILFVLGASSDIGSMLIKSSIDNYTNVIAHYHCWNDKLEELKQDYESKILFVQADFTDIDSVNAMIAYIKEKNMIPDHIVHFPAAKVFNKKFEKLECEEFQIGWEISVYSFVVILQNFLPFMKKKKYGKVVVMLSKYTKNVPPKYQSSYVTVKYALLGLLKSLAVEYEDKGITFNGVSPDMTDTKFISELPDLLKEQYASNKAKHRILNIEEVIPTFQYLLSDGADCVSGANILIE